MTRYADPQRCPDCGQPIQPGAVACAACALPLRGETAAQLFQTLSAADALLATLRASAPGPRPDAPQAAGTVAPPAPGTAPPAQSAPGVPQPLPPRSGMSAASVPRILLGLGAACLLIAALVFLAVTWSVMGVGGRTATLVGFTVIAGALTALMARRNLRGAAESLSLVALGLLTLDAFGAREAGWVGEMSSPTFLVLLGVLLGGAATTVVLTARRTPVTTLTGPELVTGLGVAIAAMGVATQEGWDHRLAFALAALLAGATAVGAHRIRLPFAAAAAGLVAGFWWLVQLGHAVDTLHHATLRELWVDLEGWPFLASAVLAGLVVLVRPLPLALRVAAAAAAYGVLSLAAVLPALDESATSAALAAIGVLTVAGLVPWLLPGPWGLSASAAQAAAGVATLAFAMSIGVVALDRMADAAGARWAGTTSGRLVGELSSEMPAAWLLPLCVVAILGTLASLRRASETVDRALAAVSDASGVVGLVVASAIGTLAVYPVPVWVVLALLLATAASFVAWWLRRPSVVRLVAAAIFLAVGTALSWYDEWLTVAALTTLLFSAGVVHLRAAQTDLSAVAGALVATALTGSVWTWGDLVVASAPWVGATGLGLLGATVLTLHLYPSPWWSCESSRTARAGYEVGAVASALPLSMAGILLASDATQATWTAVYLTLAGASVTALSLLRTDRQPLVWPGGALLVLASWVRLWDIGVREPEPYTLPTALVLVAVGLLHLRRHHDAYTMTALAPGLVLGLLPSLLWALADPTGVRSLLLGLACFALVLGGVRLRWAAPMTLGAVAGGLLVLRLAAPYVDDAVPRWVLIGAAGTILILTGVTWERRLQEARQVVGYVRGLR